MSRPVIGHNEPQPPAILLSGSIVRDYEILNKPIGMSLRCVKGMVAFDIIEIVQKVLYTMVTLKRQPNRKRW